MRQRPSTPATRYEVTDCKPTDSDGYPQRIKMWEVIKKLESANRAELLRALQAAEYKRPNGAAVDEAYCRIELTDMTKRGFLRRISD